MRVCVVSVRLNQVTSVELCGCDLKAQGTWYCVSSCDIRRFTSCLKHKKKTLKYWEVWWRKCAPPPLPVTINPAVASVCCRVSELYSMTACTHTFFYLQSLWNGVKTTRACKLWRGWMKKKVHFPCYHQWLRYRVWGMSERVPVHVHNERMEDTFLDDNVL